MKKIYALPIAFIKRLSYLLPGAIFVFGLTARSQPYTAFNQGTQPGFAMGAADPAANNYDGPAGTAIETGVKFRVTQPGNIHGVWYYKGTSNTGDHTANLWDVTDSTALRTGFAADEPSTGWRYVDFATDYHVVPGVTYIASVYMPTGRYAVTGGFFSGPVTANGISLLCNCDMASPNNAVFHYTSTGPLTSGPPRNNFGGGNYWIDVSFTPDFSLPVTLSDFKATTVNSNISLAWKTDHEFNNKGFEIQRSNNGSDWYAISFVNSAGDGTTTRNYGYNDKSLAPGTYYYRLKQSDLDGRSTFSAIVSAAVSGKGMVSLFQNYPNPFTAITSIRFDLPRTQHARLSLLDLSGRELKILTDKVGEAGSHVITLDATSLVRQTYLVRLQTENGILTKKIVVR